MLGHDPRETSARLEQLRLLRRAREEVELVAGELPASETLLWRGPAADAARSRDDALRVAMTSALATLAAAERSAAGALAGCDG